MVRKCDHCRKEGARLRCRKCESCWFCDKKCAKRAWKVHKVYCTANPTLKKHVAVEMAIERALTRVAAAEPSPEPPADAVCYICMEFEGPIKGEPVVRGCACRGESAGFVHVDCLAKMATGSEWIHLRHGSKIMSRWGGCALCHQRFTGVLKLEMNRRWWRRYRDARTSARKQRSILSLGIELQTYKETEATEQLYEERAVAPGDTEFVSMDLTREIERARVRAETDRSSEAIDMLIALRPRIERCDAVGLRGIYAECLRASLANVGRYEEALPVAVEAVQHAIAFAGPESEVALAYAERHAKVLTHLGLWGEAKAMLPGILATQARVLGADHPDTRETQKLIDYIDARELLDKYDAQQAAKLARIQLRMPRMEGEDDFANFEGLDKFTAKAAMLQLEGKLPVGEVDLSPYLPEKLPWELELKRKAKLEKEAEERRIKAEHDEFVRADPKDADVRADEFFAEEEATADVGAAAAFGKNVPSEHCCMDHHHLAGTPAPSPPPKEEEAEDLGDDEQKRGAWSSSGSSSSSEAVAKPVISGEQAAVVDEALPEKGPPVRKRSTKKRGWYMQ
eukprot:CAMPEP_0185703156 /NCGR_PEP_ID=MMETSP1164-20130828/13800_1 /TAXON_ID=1104430 /ORGANISM="Chrysoreinhardia sp, Strain CCMP2950" /LENGTH=567 /DNA_ID=CAMNT_0028370427 /DNA_START=55 /DNA_END=1758 /DNA_ORIENTATION=+